MKTPEHIKEMIINRIGEVEEELIDSMLPISKLRCVCGLELGDASWADTLIDWARDCGMKIENTGE